MLRAWLLGVAVIAIVDALWLVCLQTRVFSPFLLFLVQLAPLLAGFLSAFLSPTSKLLVGASTALPAAVSATLFNSVHQMLGGASDFAGTKGGVILFGVSLVYAIAVCALGAIAGWFVSTRVLQAQGR
jgi:hypothetical protein